HPIPTTSARTRSGATSITVPRACRRRSALGETLQEERFRKARALELAEVDALVRTVRARARVLDTGDHDLGLREQLREVEEERDRAARADVHRLVAPRLRERALHRLVGRAARLRAERLARGLLRAVD